MRNQNLLAAHQRHAAGAGGRFDCQDQWFFRFRHSRLKKPSAQVAQASGLQMTRGSLQCADLSALWYAATCRR